MEDPSLRTKWLDPLAENIWERIQCLLNPAMVCMSNIGIHSNASVSQASLFTIVPRAAFAAVGCQRIRRELSACIAEGCLCQTIL